MRIAVLTTSFPLTPESASGVFVLRLVQHLPSSVDVTVLTPCSTNQVRPAGLARFRLHCFRYAPRRWQTLAHQPGGIPSALREHQTSMLLLPSLLASMFWACLHISRRVDLIHANWSISGFVAGLVGKLTRTPVITTLRGTDVAKANRSVAFHHLLKWSVRLSVRVIAVSEAIQDTVRRKFPGQVDKILVISDGTEPTLAVLPSRAERNLRADTFRLLFVGSLVPNKGVDTIIRAVSFLKERSSTVLSVVGAGPEEDPLRELAASLGTAEHVAFVGQVPPDQIATQLRDADCLILASHSEGRPNVILEAMAAGVPVIASDIEGVREIAADGRTGLLFPPGDAKGLASAIIRLREDPVLCARLATAARSFILKEGLTWPDTARRYAEVYREAVRC